MKRVLLICFFAAAFFSFDKVYQDEIISALKQGNAIALSEYFDNKVDVKLPGSEELADISKEEAAKTLNRYFNDINVKGFTLTSKREMSGTMYIAGKLQTVQKDYNITLMVRNKGDKPLIITVRIN